MWFMLRSGGGIYVRVVLLLASCKVTKQNIIENFRLDDLIGGVLVMMLYLILDSCFIVLYGHECPPNLLF